MIKDTIIDVAQQQPKWRKDIIYLNPLMTLRLQIRKKMLERSPRVKAIDFHPQHPWILLGLYSGTIALYDYSTNTCIRMLEASNFPVRAVKFIPSKQWMASGSDDQQLRIFNYNTMEKVKSIEAHQDFMRAIIMHPTEPYLITCSDDAKIKIWNYDKDFLLTRTLDEHKHFVLCLALNPKDMTKFASGSMDKSVKIWNITTEGKANQTLTGHNGAINTIDFYKGDKPHLATGSDDKTIKIWDYQTKQCLKTISVHTNMVTGVTFHPELPILISTSDDGTSNIYHSNSYAILNTLEYNLGSGWAVSVAQEDHTVLAFGYDEGSVVIKIGSDEPIVSIHNGKLIWAKSMDIYSANLKAANHEECLYGQKLKVNSKELGSSDIYPTYVRHSSNGHHFGLCNSKEFVVIKISSFKSVILGKGNCLVWNGDSSFAVLENDNVHLYNNFEYSSAFKVPFVPHHLFEGHLLTVAGTEAVLLYEWDDISKPLHKLDLNATKVWWSADGSLLSVATQEKLMVYSFNKQKKSLTQMLVITDRISSGVFVGDIFYFTSKSGKIYFSFLGKSFFYSHAEKKQFILGPLPEQERLFLFDKTNSVFSYHVPFELFAELHLFIAGKRTDIPEVPNEQRDRVAKCLHAFDLKKQAYKITENQNHKFDLALQLGYVRQAHKLATTMHSAQKTKAIADIALKSGDVELAISAYKEIDDLNSLLLIYSTLSLPEKLMELGERAEKLTKMNVAYMCYYLTNKPQKCVDVLISSKRYAEAALFCRTYLSERVSECVKLWRNSLNDKTLADKISDPAEEEDQESESEKDKEEEEAE